MRRDLFGSNGRAPARRFGRVLGDEELHGVLAEHWSTATGKQWVGRSAASLREPDAQCRDAMSRERRDAFFAAFAVTADMRPVREDHIRALQPDELSHPQPGLDGECQERVVAPADPGGAVGLSSSATASSRVRNEMSARSKRFWGWRARVGSIRRAQGARGPRI